MEAGQIKSPLSKGDKNHALCNHRKLTTAIFPLFRTPKIKRAPLLKILLAFSTLSASLTRDHLWQCLKLAAIGKVAVVKISLCLHY